jgi:flagellar motor switch protein FliM
MESKHGLSEEEINALSNALGSSLTKGRTSGAVRTYDFLQVERRNEQDLKWLQTMLSNIERSWSGTLIAVLKTDTLVHVESPVRTDIGTYTGIYRAPRALFEVGVPPVSGNVYIDMSTELARGIVERMAGGAEFLKAESKAMTPVEWNVIKCLADKLIGNLGAAWSLNMKVKTELTGCRSDLATLSRNVDDLVYVVKVMLRTSSVQDQVNIVIPVSVADAVTGSLNDGHAGGAGLQTNPEISKSLKSALETVNLPACVVLGQANLHVHDVIGMEIGDIVKLDTCVSDSLGLKIGDQVRFQARPGLVGKRISVKIVK